MGTYCSGWRQNEDGTGGYCMHTGRRYTDQDSHWKDTEHAQYVGTLECRNDETCRNCPKGYFCCRIYNGDDKPGTRDQSMWFQEWVEGFHPHPESYGVQPLFDPLEVWMDDPEHKKQREELLAKGIDPEYCQYYAPGSGCIIEWPKRPIQCRQYNCGLFMPEDYSPMEVKIVTK